MTQVNTILPTTDRTSEPPKEERWRRIEPLVRQDLEAQDIDLNPRNLPEILAKVYTNEVADGKGIFLLGPTGTGKSRRMEFAAEAFEIAMVDATTLCDRLATVKDDYERLEVLNLIPPRWSERPAHCCDLIIDDLGTEPQEYVVYGTHRNLIINAITKRYDRFPEYKTHFTSNLPKENIRLLYGERIWSRLNEMCVFVSLTGKDRRMGDVR